MELRLERSAIELDATRLRSGLATFIGRARKGDKPQKTDCQNKKRGIGGYLLRGIRDILLEVLRVGTIGGGLFR